MVRTWVAAIFMCSLMGSFAVRIPYIYKKTFDFRLIIKLVPSSNNESRDANHKHDSNIRFQIQAAQRDKTLAQNPEPRRSNAVM